MKIQQALKIIALLALATLANAQTWTPLTHQPGFGATTALLLTDGTVMVQDSAFTNPNHWWRLKPDSAGSYVNGTWSQLASLPFGYDPLYYASAVLADGRVVIVGGEYNFGSLVESTQAAIYDPQNNTWTSFSGPPAWFQIGDAQSTVLPDGTFMLGNCCNSSQALLNASTLTWTITGTGKADSNSEESWTALPNNVSNPNNGGVLTVDVHNFLNSEIYNPNTGMWSTAGSTGVQLVTCNEIGPAVLRPDGSVFATGATSNTAIYNSYFPAWRAGPSFPAGLGVADGPAALLPNGNVLVNASPNSPCYAPGSKFFEFNGTTLTAVANPPRANVDPAYVGRMLVLPTGQILFTDGSSDVEVYTSTGTYNFVWQPTLNSYPSNLTVGASWYQILGTQLNGSSQGAMYGDDAQSATNYPLVRITNNATGHVFYAFTHNHSSMGVATGGVQVSTLFDPPLNMERGLSTLVVVANGIPSAPVTVNVW